MTTFRKTNDNEISINLTGTNIIKDKYNDRLMTLRVSP